MREPSCLHGVLHTNAHCLGSDQEQKGLILGSATGSSLTSLCLQHGTSFLGQTGRKNAVLGRMEDSRSETRGDTLSHLLAPTI